MTTLLAFALLIGVGVANLVVPEGSLLPTSTPVAVCLVLVGMVGIIAWVVT